MCVKYRCSPSHTGPSVMLDGFSSSSNFHDMTVLALLCGGGVVTSAMLRGSHEVDNMDTPTHQKSTTTTGARALVDALLREGVDHVFGIPGTQNLAVIDALRDTPQMRFILTRHEQGAAFMAYGFARASGRPAIVTATEGPGVTNLATGIAAAYKGLVPVISICGMQEMSMRERDATQDIDQTTFMRPITKWAYTIPT